MEGRDICPQGFGKIKIFQEGEDGLDTMIIYSNQLFHLFETRPSVFLFVFSKPKHFEHQISKSLVITVFLTARRRREKIYLFDRFSIDFTFQNGTKIWNFLISEPKC